MYLLKLELKNIRCFEEFELTFPEGGEAGWHVLIGDNGSGKSAVLKAIAAALVEYRQLYALRQDIDSWVSCGTDRGLISMNIQYSSEKVIQNWIDIKIDKQTKENEWILSSKEWKELINNPLNYKNLFSLAYGPYRRFTGGTDAKDLGNATRAARHFSIFGEDVALRAGLEWLLELDRKRLKEQELHTSVSTSSLAEEPTATYSKVSSGQIFEWVKTFINTSNLLPNQIKFVGVDINDKLVFEDRNKVNVKISEMSDGYRSMLALLFDILRWMVEICGADEVFSAVRVGNGFIPVEGVILIDEIDAHLHPTWQTRIGGWFRQYFPNIQFIVTTHSPLICRGCETGGTIWRLPTPGSGEAVQEVTGTAKNKLIYGNVLEAYGTEMFGDNVSRSESGAKKVSRLAELNIKSIKGQLSQDEEIEYESLQHEVSLRK